MARKFRVKKDFEHYPADVDPAAPKSVWATAGETVDNIHPDSIDGLLAAGFIEEVGPAKKKTEEA